VKRTSDSEKLARLCRDIAEDKKAEDIVLLDLRGISTVADFFVVCSGTSEPHLRAISDEIERRLREKLARRPHGVDGFPASRWIVMDYSDVLIHIFHPELRRHYALESLWGDAKQI
jgi:ribosome-associated protein